MIRKLLAVSTLALALTGAVAAPALAAGPSACLTTTVTINGTDLPTNGTNCVEPPA